MQSHAQEDIGNLYDIDVLLRTQQQLINSQPSNRQPSSPQLSKLQLSNQQPNNWQPVRLQPSPGKVERNNRAVIANGLSNRTAQIKTLDNNNEIAHGLFVNVTPQQAQLQQERYKHQAMIAAFRQQQALERLRQQAVDGLKQQQAHLFSLMERVKKLRQENQKRNSELWQRIVKQRNKHIQRRFYEHALHDDVDDDDNGRD